MRACKTFFGAAALAAFLLCAPSLFAAPAAEDAGNRPSSVPGYSVNGLRKLADAIVRTGVAPDHIASLYRPAYVTVSDASLSMDDDEVVFVVEYPNGRTRIYPQRIMVWHEAVNDVLPDSSGAMPPLPIPGVTEESGESYTITYSPLTGSVVGFRSRAGNYPTTFGISGDLLDANSVLYDRLSNSRWVQLLGVCIEGPFLNRRLDRIPVLWTKWGGAKKRWLGKAEVLSRSTGFRRSYGKDPYGSYQSKGNYYDDVRLMFALSRLDDRLPPKKRILGIEAGDLYAAVQKDAVREARVLNFTVGLTPMVALYEEELDAVRVFERRLNGQTLSFVIFEDKLVDEQTRSEWDATGLCLYGRLRDKTLPSFYNMDSMWFAWAAFHRDTLIFPPVNASAAGAP